MTVTHPQQVLKFVVFQSDSTVSYDHKAWRGFRIHAPSPSWGRRAEQPLEPTADPTLDIGGARVRVGFWLAEYSPAANPIIVDKKQIIIIRTKLNNIYI